MPQVALGWDSWDHGFLGSRTAVNWWQHQADRQSQRSWVAQASLALHPQKTGGHPGRRLCHVHNRTALIRHHCQWDSHRPKAEGEASRCSTGWPVFNACCCVSGKGQRWRCQLPALSDRRWGTREPSLGKVGPGLAFYHLGCLTPS